MEHGKDCIFYTQYTDTRKIFLTKNMAHFSFLSPWLNFFSKSILRLFVSRVSVLYSRGMFSLFSETPVRSLETWWNSCRINLPVCKKKLLKERQNIQYQYHYLFLFILGWRCNAMILHSHGHWTIFYRQGFENIIYPDFIFCITWQLGYLWLWDLLKPIPHQPCLGHIALDFVC